VFEKVVVYGLLVAGPLAVLAYFTVTASGWFAWVGLSILCALIVAAILVPAVTRTRDHRVHPPEELSRDVGAARRVAERIAMVFGQTTRRG
jgi:membrane protein YdbS with pleckstrin-like domain